MAAGSDVLLILVAVLFPPAAVLLMSGCSCDVLINILLTLLGFIPGHIHAFWLIYKKMKAEERYGPGGYRYVGNGTYESHPGMVGTAQPAPAYGATSY